MTEWVHQLPAWYAKVCTAVLFVSIISFVWTLPKKFVYQGAPDGKRWRDLRIWATILILIQSVIYAFF
jgi:hypothetical protein